MLLKLVEEGQGSQERREILIDREEFLIGRGADCDLRLSAAAVSRHHCLLRCRGAEVVLQDLGSSNGTFVNEQRVRSQRAVQDGDVLRVATFRFRIVMDPISGIHWGQAAEAEEWKTTHLEEARSPQARPPQSAKDPPTPA
jgi:predicted component of type VI protein secretion system